MSIPLSSNFDLVTALPLDARFVATTLVARDAIAPIQRHEGLLVYVIADQTTYQLQGGITNADWYPIGTGAPGTNGSSILSGAGDPVDLTDGVDGDFWINLTTYDFFGPKTAGAWGAAVFNMVGPEGPQGDPGPSVAIDWEGVEISPIASRINFVGPGVADVQETAPGEVQVTIQGGGGGEPSGPMIFGECDDPLNIPVTGLRVASGHMSRDVMEQIVFVQGNGGPIDISGVPQLDGHNFIGALLTLVGKSDTNTLKLVEDSANGLYLNGDAVLGENDVLRLIWRGDMWVERRRSF